MRPSLPPPPGVRTPNPRVPAEVRHRYGDAIERARPHGRGGPCEDAKLSLLREDGIGRDLVGTEDNMGRGTGRFQHEFVRTKDLRYVLDPVAQQMVDRGLTTWQELIRMNLDAAVWEGIFAAEQWERFKRLGGG